MPAVLDTGASAGLHLPLGEARRLGLEDAWKSGEPTESIGARGSYEARKAIVDAVQVGGETVRDVVTLISPTAGAVLIGNGFLQHFVLTLDYQGGRVCLERRVGLERRVCLEPK